jgi:uroporphyrinogen-III synthase
MLFVNTRPQDRAFPLTEAMQGHGVDVLEVPLLELIESPWSFELQALYTQLSHVKVIVVVSPTAVDVGMKYLQQSGVQLKDLAHITWVAVGDKTAEILKKYQISSVVPDVETSEGMLNLPILKMLNSGDHVAFWRGEGGRQFMMETLIEQGITVLNFVLYIRQCPECSKQNILKIVDQLNKAVNYKMLITSEASWLNWLALIEHHSDVLNKADFWVLGDRLYDILLQTQKQNKLEYKITKLSNLKIENLLQHIGVA